MLSKTWFKFLTLLEKTHEIRFLPQYTPKYTRSYTDHRLKIHASGTLLTPVFVTESLIMNKNYFLEQQLFTKINTHKKLRGGSGLEFVVASVFIRYQHAIFSLYLFYNIIKEELEKITNWRLQPQVHKAVRDAHPRARSSTQTRTLIWNC